MHYVYLIQSLKNKEIYIGQTSNLKVRMNQHNSRLSKSTKGAVPWKLIYCEVYRSSDDAKTRENRLKYYGRALYHLKRRLSKSLL